MTAGPGYFYAIQLVPDLAPNRIKFGWTLDTGKRLRNHRTAAPTARLLRAWPCHWTLEQPAIKAVVSGHQIGPEVFDVDDVEGLLASIDALAQNGWGRAMQMTPTERLTPTEQPMAVDTYYTVNEVAEKTKTNVQTVRRWIRDKKLKASLLGGKRTGYRVAEAELNRWLAEGVQGKAEGVSA